MADNYLIGNVSGDIAHFRTVLEEPLKSCKVSFEPIQAGDEDSSPSNVRVISGRTGLELTHSGVNLLNGENISIDWQSQAGVLYGGYVDLVTGELVQTHKLVTLTGEEPNAIKSWDAYSFVDSSVYAPDNGGYYVVACSHTNNLVTGSTMWSTATSGGGSGQDVAVAGSKTSQIRYRDRNNMGDSLESYKAYLKNQYDNGTPVQIVMKLITPIHYQLTPLQISTFKGINNFWSEAGTIDISYCFKDAPEILKLRRQIELNSPHVEKITSGNTVDSLQVAAFRTDMTAPLKECKVSFTYTQSGSGNPKPDNVRPISGRSMQSVSVNGMSHSIDFGMNVYKGTVDLVTGILVAELIDYPISSTRYSQKNDSAGWAQFVLNTDIAKNVKEPLFSDMFSTSNPSGTVGRMSWYLNQLFFNVPISQVTSFDNAGLLAWMEEYHPQFICTLKTPYVYQLTPQQIKMIRGDNTIAAADSTEISVKYWTH